MERCKLENSKSKGTGNVDQIMGLLKEICLGQFYFLRDSLLINATLYSMEALHGIKKKHLEIIEKSYRNFMRKVFDASKGIKPEDEFAREVFEAQKKFKTKDCWVIHVRFN